MDISASSISSAYTSSAYTTASEDNTTLSMNDFFELMVAQLQNQSMLDPVDSSEFIGQMAQFSTLSQMSELTSVCQMTYAVSLLGKKVTVSSTESSGVTKAVTGVVDNVSYQSGTPSIEIDGISYDLSALLEVEGN